jgi:hypothetical protein
MMSWTDPNTPAADNPAEQPAQSESTPPATQQPTAEQPATEAPAAADNPAEQPAQTESTPPATQQPTVEQPATEAPAAADKPAEASVAAASPADQLASDVEELRAKLAALEQRATSGQLAVAPTDTELEAKIAELRAQFKEWPGDSTADLPQPFDLKAHGLPQPGVTRDHLPGGQPDEISPVVVAHNKPLLTAGMAGDAVRELASLLKAAGYDTSISRGQNWTGSFDDTVTAAVNAFKRDFHVVEDPSQFNNDLQQAERFVGPYIWEALIRVADRAKVAL